MKGLRIRSKIWLEVDGQPFLGDGRYRLLSAIQEHGSINAAARHLNLSYRKVWAQLNAMEESAPFPLMERRTGGKGGGATQLTSETRKLMSHYCQMRNQINFEADRCFSETFKNRDDSLC